MSTTHEVVRQTEPTHAGRSADAGTGLQHSLVVELDLTGVERARRNVAEDFEGRHEAPLTISVLLAEAATRVLARDRTFTTGPRTEDGAGGHANEVHIGVVVKVDGVDIVRVVRQADRLSLIGLSRRIAELSSGGQESSTAGRDAMDAALTVREVGTEGLLLDAPALERSRPAMLTLGTIIRRPAVVLDTFGQERLAIRSLAYLTLTFDRGLVDRAAAVHFLTAVKDRLERTGEAVLA